MEPFLRQDHLNDTKVIAHEVKHVAQYGRLGGIPARLRQYLAEIQPTRYPANPIEQKEVAFAEGECPTQRGPATP